MKGARGAGRQAGRQAGEAGQAGRQAQVPQIKMRLDALPEAEGPMHTQQQDLQEIVSGVHDGVPHDLVQ